MRTGRSGKKLLTQGPAVTTTAFASSVVERVDARLLLEARAVSERALDERAVREVGADDARLRLEERSPPVGHADRPALSCWSASSSSYSAAGSCERVCRALPRALDQLEQPVQLEQLLPRLLLELPPAGERLLRQLDELDLRVRKPDDPRPAMARAVLVADVELLEEEDVVASACERIGGRGSHDPRADDNDLCLHGAIFALQRSGSAISIRSSASGALT